MRRSALLVVVIVAALAIPSASTSGAPPSIMGGGPANFATSPWQVGLLNAWEPDSLDAQICGGTLIAPNVVLTAAHCLYDGEGQMLGTDDVQVLTGTSLLRSGLGDRSPIVGGFVEDNDDDFWSPDDLAVLWAAHTSPLAVPLPVATFADPSGFRTGSRVGVAGWGANRRHGRQLRFPRQLKQYRGTVRSKSRGFLYIRSMTASACFGDSGGPAVGTSAAGTPYLVGVVHGGRLDCATGTPAMFVNVAAQQRFLQTALATGPHGGPAPVNGYRPM